MRTAFFSIAFLLVSIPSFAQTITLAPIAKLEYCTGDTLIVPYSTTGTFATDNRFVLQWSNDGFHSFTIIARDSSRSGHFTVAFTSAASGYKMRVASTDPLSFSDSNAGKITVHTLVQPSLHLHSRQGVFDNNSDPRVTNCWVDLADDTILLWDASKSETIHAWSFDQD